MRCRSCEKDLSVEAFYASNKSKCKDCVRAAVKANRAEKVDYYKEFDRQRGSLPHRVEARREYQKTEAYRDSHRKSVAKQLAEHPERRSARVAVGNAVRDGRLEKQPCFTCGSSKVEAHHADYSRPLDVVWLCRTHHRAAHNLVSTFAGLAP